MKVDIDYSEFSKKFRSGTQKGLAEWADVVAKESSAQCPLDMGDLRRSLFVEVDEDNVDIGYSEDYAIYVHEGNYNFQRGKNNKYLEGPFKENAKTLESTLAKNIKI